MKRTILKAKGQTAHTWGPKSDKVMSFYEMIREIEVFLCEKNSRMAVLHSDGLAQCILKKDKKGNISFSTPSGKRSNEIQPFYSFGHNAVTAFKRRGEVALGTKLSLSIFKLEEVMA